MKTIRSSLTSSLPSLATHEDYGFLYTGLRIMELPTSTLPSVQGSAQDGLGQQQRPEQGLEPGLQSGPGSGQVSEPELEPGSVQAHYILTNWPWVAGRC